MTDAEIKIERLYWISAGILAITTFLGVFIPSMFFHIYYSEWYLLVGLYPVMLWLLLKILDKVVK